MRPYLSVAGCALRKAATGVRFLVGALLLTLTTTTAFADNQPKPELYKQRRDDRGVVMVPAGSPGIPSLAFEYNDSGEDEGFFLNEIGPQICAVINGATVACFDGSGLVMPGFTEGSVVFIDAAGGLDEDNANFFWDDANNRLGLGTITPAEVLDVVGNVQVSGQFISTVATGTPPLVVASTDEVANLRSATASALAANGTNCGAGEFAAGVDAAGNAEGCAVPGSSIAFLDLTDTPASYAGQALKLVQVNAGETGLQFVTDAPTATALAANGSNCSSGSGAGGVDASGVAEDCTNYAEAADSMTFTNKTIDVEGTGNVITTVSKVWIPFASCQNATAGLLWDSPTSNAAAAACVTGTNTQKGVADFDATTDESLQNTLRLPEDWTSTGGVDARVVWLAAATTGSAGICVQVICVADAETDDPAFPAQAAGNCTSDAAKGTTLQTNIATITGTTITGCAAGELAHVQVSRDANGGAVTDDMAGDVRAIGLELTLRRAQ